MSHGSGILVYTRNAFIDICIPFAFVVTSFILYNMQYMFDHTLYVFTGNVSALLLRQRSL